MEMNKIIIISFITSSCAISPALILTPYIKNNNITYARNISLVDSSQFHNVISHSGYITVDQKYNSNLFFWYFPINNGMTNSTPLIIWLQGGPGASSLAGLFEEIGPFYVSQSSPDSVNLRKIWWGKQHSLLFIDNPVGAGYSFTNSNEGFIRNMDMCADHLYEFLQQFLIMFPELRMAPLYIAGESYAGHYVPAFAYKIITEKESGIGQSLINLQGLIMGNPLFSHEDVADYTKMFYQWGLVDSQGALAAKQLQDSYNEAIKNNNASEAYRLKEILLDKLQDISMQKQLFNVLKDDINVKSFVNFIISPNIKQAIHVGDISFTSSNITVHEKLIPDFFVGVTSKVDIVLEHCRILIYCGQLDLTTPCVPSGEARRKHLNWSHRDDFFHASRLPWWFEDKIAGYVKSGGGLTEVLVRGAGHLVAIDKPDETEQLISYFIRGLDLPLPPNYSDDPSNTPNYTVPTDELTTSRYTYKTMAIISLVCNGFLVLTLVAALYYCYKNKRRYYDYFTNPVDDDSLLSDSILTMS